MPVGLPGAIGATAAPPVEKEKKFEKDFVTLEISEMMDAQKTRRLKA